jgi:hypothetical protein
MNEERLTFVLVQRHDLRADVYRMDSIGIGNHARTHRVLSHAGKA